MIINEEKLEELLVKNWTQFIDARKLTNFVQNEVQNQINNFMIIGKKKSRINSNVISVSRVYFEKNNYFLWVEFIVLLKDKIAEGTLEIYFSKNNFENEPKVSSAFGNLYHV